MIQNEKFKIQNARQVAPAFLILHFLFLIGAPT
jgi:hypothetical protein